MCANRPSSNRTAVYDKRLRSIEVGGSSWDKSTTAALNRRASRKSLRCHIRPEVLIYPSFQQLARGLFSALCPRCEHMRK